VKIGIIGLGFMGATHLKAFLNTEGVTLAAVSATNPRRLSGDLSDVGGNLGREAGTYDFSDVRKYTDWQDLVNDPNVDAVDVCLPTHLHLPVTVAALKAGKHVLCEKPMALTAAQCDEMLSAARERGKILMIAHVLRFWPEYNFLNHFVKSGEYGAIRTATFVRRCGVPDWSKWAMDEERSGGAILDLLIHDIDQVLRLFGPPAKVAAKALNEQDSISATLLYPNGPEVRVQGGWFPSGTPFAMGFQVAAQRGELELTPDGLRLNDGSGEIKAVKPDGPDAYDAEIGYFVECCRMGQQPVECPPEQSALAVKLALALKQSRAENGAPISFAA
jgi:predicted dehydrogenase